MVVSKNCAIFAEKMQRCCDLLRNKTINLNNMEHSELWRKVRKVLINKYAITLLVFAVLLGFIGEQSLVKQFRRGKEIDSLRLVIQKEKAAAESLESTLQSLENKDTIERIAREYYKMHKENEDLYMVD